MSIWRREDFLRPNGTVIADEAAYVTQDHGGNTGMFMRPIDPKTGSYDMPVEPNGYTDVPLLRVHIHTNVKLPRLEFPTKTLAEGFVLLTKSSDVSNHQSPKTWRYTVPKGVKTFVVPNRCVFVAYLDCLTKLRIRCKLPGVDAAHLKSDLLPTPDRTPLFTVMKFNPDGTTTTEQLPMPAGIQKQFQNKPHGLYTVHKGKVEALKTAAEKAMASNAKGGGNAAPASTTTDNE